MAEFKNNPKDMPKVIALGVAVAGILGYGAFSFFGDSGTKEHPTVRTKPSSTQVALTRTGDAAQATPPETPPANAPGLSLPNSFNPDPFRSLEKPKKKNDQGQPKHTAAPAASTKQPLIASSMSRAPLLPPAGGSAGLQGTTVSAPAPVAAPEPPVMVTGTSLCSGSDTAILEVGGDHRVVQLGDPVFGEYRVKRITIDGVVIGSKARPHWFIGKTTKAKMAKAAGAELPAGTGGPGTDPQLGTLAVQPQTH